MECAGCHDRNVFNLGIVYCANSGDLVVLFRSVCAHRGGNKALAMLDLDLSSWTPLVNAMDCVFMRELFPPPLSGRKGVVEGVPEHSPNWEESMRLVMSWGMELTGLQRVMWKDLGESAEFGGAAGTVEGEGRKLFVEQSGWGGGQQAQGWSTSAKDV